MGIKIIMAQKPNAEPGLDYTCRCGQNMKLSQVLLDAQGIAVSTQIDAFLGRGENHNYETTLKIGDIIQLPDLHIEDFALVLKATVTNVKEKEVDFNIRLICDKCDEDVTIIVIG